MPQPPCYTYLCGTLDDGRACTTVLGFDGTPMITVVGDADLRIVDTPTAPGVLIGQGPCLDYVRDEVLSRAEAFKPSLGFGSPELYDQVWSLFIDSLTGAFGHRVPASEPATG